MSGMSGDPKKYVFRRPPPQPKPRAGLHPALYVVEGSVNVTPTTVALVLTTYAPTVATPRVVTPTTAALTLTTFAPTVSTPVNCTPSTAALTLTAYAPTVATPVNCTPTTRALALTAYAPTVVGNQSADVTPTTATLTLTAYAPTVTVSAVGEDDGSAGTIPHGKESRRGPQPNRPTYRVFDTYSSKSVAQQQAQAAEQEQIRVRKVANRRAAILAAVMAACEDEYS